MNVFDNNKGALHRRSRRRTLEDSNLIPLINIVFLLLVFFMVAGQIQIRDGSDVNPPSTDHVESSASLVVDIVIDRRNELMFDGVAVSLAQLKRRLEDERYASAEYLLVKADRDVKASELGVLLEALRESGADSIRLLTQTSGS